jgi:superoxide dismutase, Fe-Mn family
MEEKNMTDYKKYTNEVLTWLNNMDTYLENEHVKNEQINESLENLTGLASNLNRGEPTAQEIETLHEGIFAFSTSISGQLEKRSSQKQGTHEPVGSGKHTLPPLPYPYNALEPVISEEIMRLHHDIHHKTYVDGLNKAEVMMKKARDVNDYSLIKHWEKEAAFHGSGHYLHTIFWEIMTPNGGGKPSGHFLKQIEKDFGSFEAFKKHFSEAAKAVEGVGWAILVWAPRAGKLEILQSELHMILTQWDTIPLLVLDVWEHAYYLQYKTDKAAYVDGWWKLVNWPNVIKRYEEAKKLIWVTY